MNRELTETYLVNEDLSSSRAHEQHGPSQSVPVPVQLLRAHRIEEIGKHSANVAVHPLQGHIQTEPRRLVHEGLQSSDIWGETDTVRTTNKNTENSSGSLALEHKTYKSW